MGDWALSCKPLLSISVPFGISANIRNGREIQCFPYAGFLVCVLLRDQIYLARDASTNTVIIY